MATSSEHRATIGTSVSIKGEISGAEDILIEGSVEGVINLKQNIVTVATTGRVKAHIYGLTVHIEGEVTGDLFGTEQVVIHKTGKVIGNITAPRISLEDGARVKGTIDTEVTGNEKDTRVREAIRLEKADDHTSDSTSLNLGVKKNGVVVKEEPKNAQTPRL